MNWARSANRGLWGCAMLVVSGLAGCEEPAAVEPAAVEAAAVETSVAVVGPGPSPVDAGNPPSSPAGPPATTSREGNSPPAASSAVPPNASPPPVTPPPTSDAVASAVSPPAAAPRKRASRAGEAREISFDDIKFEMVKGDPFLRTMLTPAIEALTGQRVRLRGYMLPSFQQSGLTQFVLVRDNMECCFGPGAALFDCVVINMVPGRTAEFSVRPVAVEGTFAIQDFLGPDGKHLAIYEMAGEVVR